MAQSKAQFGYRRHADQIGSTRRGAVSVVVVGAGPVGFVARIDLARRARALCC